MQQNNKVGKVPIERGKKLCNQSGSKNLYAAMCVIETCREIAICPGGDQEEGCCNETLARWIKLPED